MLALSHKNSSTEDQVKKAAELLQALQDQEASARAAVQESNEQLIQLQSNITAAHTELAELQQRLEVERREAEVSKSVRQLRKLADNFNQKSAELAAISREIATLDPHGQLVENSDQVGATRLPVLFYSLGTEKIFAIQVSELHNWEKRESFSKQAAQLIKQFGI